MTPTDLIDQYRVVLQERHGRMLAALEQYQIALTELLSATKLPDPVVGARAGTTLFQDLSTVAWRQEVVAKRSGPGDTTVVVRVEFTVGLTGFHCAVRDSRDLVAPLLYERSQRDFTLPRAFVGLAKQLADDATLPRDRWDATIYTY